MKYAWESSSALRYSPCLSLFIVEIYAGVFVFSYMAASSLEQRLNF